MELDDWELSAEELDSLERNALNQIAHRSSSSSTATAFSSSCTSSCSYRQQEPHGQYSTTSFPQYGHSPLNPIARSRHDNKHVDGSLPASKQSQETDDCLREQPKLSVKFFLHASGDIAAKFLYDQVLVGAFRKIPKASWNVKERLWMFPISSLLSAEKVLREISGLNVEVESLDLFVRHAIAAASAVPDLRDRYDRIPSNIESKLLPFQRDGVRFVLQHGGRVLLADEMGLGKTLQAIAVTTCINDFWPVLVLTPSSLRLHWASMIQQWLDIPSSDIHVVLSQWGGSNKGGFTIVHSNTKDSINLDGKFNIISYDIVPKLQNIILASDFKMNHIF